MRNTPERMPRRSTTTNGAPRDRKRTRDARRQTIALKQARKLKRTEMTR